MALAERSPESQIMRDGNTPKNKRLSDRQKLPKTNPWRSCLNVFFGVLLGNFERRVRKRTREFGRASKLEETAFDGDRRDQRTPEKWSDDSDGE